MVYDTPVEVKVWGDFACFTRPEMKAERVSYPVMTPSAARGVLEAIFWKPAFSWRVEEIWVLREVQFISIKRNELKQRAIDRTARAWIGTGNGYAVEDDDHRTQRNTLALRDVAYLIRANPVVRNDACDPAKFRDQFRRRVERGQCFQQPYLGCREFAANFERPGGEEQAIEVTGSLGRMLLDFDYREDSSGYALPTFFQASLDDGVLRVPSVRAEAAQRC